MSYAVNPSIDFLTAQAAGLGGMKDPAVLALATEQQRVLVSHDIGTMPSHFRAFINSGKRSPGLYLISQGLDIGPAIDELLQYGWCLKLRIGRIGWYGCRSNVRVPDFVVSIGAGLKQVRRRTKGIFF